MEKKLFLITGANGHLGSTIVNKLLENNENIRCLMLKNERDILSDRVEKVYGDVRDKESLREFFDIKDYDYVYLIHAAAKISILSKRDQSIYDINYLGCKNVMELALENNINKVVHVSSVHSIKESEEIIKDIDGYYPDELIGQYSKSKALANNMILDLVKKGLNASIVLPSGIIGPGDKHKTNSSVNTIRAIDNGEMPFVIKGGYDFVDVRDVADAIINCLNFGKDGESYILSGEYISVADLFETIKDNKKAMNIPSSLVKTIAPIYEWYYLNIKKKQPLLTPYSFYVLQSNANFSNEKAKKELAFKTHDIKDSIIESLD